MSAPLSERKAIAAQLLAGLLANPHVYASISDDLGKGPQEQELVELAVELAAALSDRVEHRGH
jgi:hypothetical protein